MTPRKRQLGKSGGSPPLYASLRVTSIASRGLDLTEQQVVEGNLNYFHEIILEAMTVLAAALQKT